MVLRKYDFIVHKWRRLPHREYATMPVAGKSGSCMMHFMGTSILSLASWLTQQDSKHAWSVITQSVLTGELVGCLTAGACHTTCSGTSPRRESSRERKVSAYAGATDTPGAWVYWRPCWSSVGQADRVGNTGRPINAAVYIDIWAKGGSWGTPFAPED